ncbi:MAG TPA: YhcH/YjgK/YiaL family protein [Parafilimonas sp.]|nr:YhcH/YjgK/YiaL family protein [Parafilimonas sp.]
MKKIILCFAITFLLANLYTTAQTTSPAMTKQQVKEWYQKKEWLSGLPWQPHESVNKEVFAKQYLVNKTYWDKAFAFLKNNDLQTMAVGRYAIDGDNVYAMITENPTKNLDSTKWESHRNYIDLQSVIKGEEKIGVADIAKLTVTMPYDASKDLANYSGDGKFYNALPATFFLFFPGDAHRPNITTNGNKPDKKIVIKIRYTE